jgi:hypothetical protein
MRACCVIPLCAFALLLVAGSPLKPAAADEKPKDRPPAKKDDKDRELHVVGIYEGYTKSDGKIHGGKAQVLLKRPGKQVTLVLVSHTPVTWEVAVDKDTKLEKVILGGYGRAAVKGTPEKVEVVEAFRGSKDAWLPYSTYKIDEPRFRAVIDALDAKTGQKIASFTGVYRAEADVLLVVENVDNDERLSADYPTPVPAAKLPKLTFQAHRYIPGERPHDVSARSFGEFTLAGPKADTLKPLPDRVSRMTYDPAGKKYYGIADHGLVEIDLEKKKVKKLDPGLNVPEISWPADVTFDTKRERVVLVTSAGGGHMYSYHPKTGNWNALAEKPAQVVAYHPKDDVVYGLKSDFRGAGTELQEINANGAVVTSVKLDGQFLPGMLGVGPGVSGVQLVPADDKLVLLIDPVGLRGSEAPAPKWSYMYLIDPKTGKAQLVWKGKATGK